MLWHWIIGWIYISFSFFIITALAQENFKCPDDYGFYPHHISCDKYWKCDNGAAELKTCGNGLAFEATDPKYLSENCDYHHNVECGDRTQFGKYEVTVFILPYYKCGLCIHNILPFPLTRSLNTTPWCSGLAGCWKRVCVAFWKYNAFWNKKHSNFLFCVSVVSLPCYFNWKHFFFFSQLSTICIWSEETALCYSLMPSYPTDAFSPSIKLLLSFMHTYEKKWQRW